MNEKDEFTHDSFYGDDGESPTLSEKEQEELAKQIDHMVNAGVDERMASERKRWEKERKAEEKAQKKAEKEQRKMQGMPGRTTLLYRNIQVNRDLSLLALIVAFFSLAGVFMGLSISGEHCVEDLAKSFGALLAGIISVIWKIYTPPGKLSKSLQEKGNKSEEELDEWGRTLLQ